MRNIQPNLHEDCQKASEVPCGLYMEWPPHHQGNVRAFTLTLCKVPIWNINQSLNSHSRSTLRIVLTGTAVKRPPELQRSENDCTKLSRNGPIDT